MTLPDPIAANRTPLGANRKDCRAAAWLERTRLLAVAGDDGGLCCYVGNEQMLKLHAHPARIFGVCEVERNVVVTAAADGALRAWAYDPFATTLISGVVVPGSGCTAMCSVGERVLLVGTKCGRLVRYSWAGRNLCLTFKMQPHVHRVDCVHAHRDLVAAASADKSVSLWCTDADQLLPLKIIPHSQRVYSVTAGDHYVVTGTKDYVHLYLNNYAADFPLASNIYVGCGIVMSVKLSGHNMIMAANGSILSFVYIDDGGNAAKVAAAVQGSHGLRSQVASRIKSSGNILDVTFLPDGSVAVVGSGDAPNALVSLPPHLIGGFHPCLRYVPESAEIRQCAAHNAAGAKRIAIEVDARDDARSPKRKRANSELTPPEHYFRGQLSIRGSIEKLEPLQIEPAVHLRSAVPPHSKSPTSVKAALSPSSPAKAAKAFLDVALPDDVYKMRKWQSKGVAREALVKLEHADFVSAMTAYMLRYRQGWNKLFVPLRRCLLKYFDDNFLSSDDFLGEHRVDAQRVFGEIKEAMASDGAVGSRVGLINQAKKFLEELIEGK